MTLFVAVLLMMLFGFSFFAGGGASPQFVVPLPAALSAAMVALASLLAYFFAPANRLSLATLIIYLGLAFTVAVLILSSGSGPINSPFIALWMLVGVFGGLFGPRVLGSLFLLVTGYLAASLFVFGVINTGSDLIIFLLAYELPLLASWLIWHHSNAHSSAQERAYSDLARELSQVANKSDIVLNAIADGVVAVDAQGAIQFINPAALEITGWKKQDAMNLDYRSIITLSDKNGADLSQDNDPIQRVLRNNKSIVNNDLTLETNSNRKLLVSVLVSPVGQIGAGAIIIFRDITKEKQEEREQAEFISTASHEMRTPVATIEGYLGLVLNTSTITIDDKAREYLSKAYNSTQHLGKLFQDLLDISRIEDGRLKNTPKVTDLANFVQEIINAFEDQAKDKGLVLLFKPQTQTNGMPRVNPVFYIDVDNDHLREVVNNLLENAIKYTKSGKVTVNIEGDDQHAKVVVHDTGIGIPPEDIPHLFQKFYRVDNTETRDIGGTGLGLYLCRKLVETMGGRLSVDSTLGVGSTFAVEFDRLSYEDATARIEEAAETTPESTGTNDG